MRHLRREGVTARAGTGTGAHGSHGDGGDLSAARTSVASPEHQVFPLIKSLLKT